MEVVTEHILHQERKLKDRSGASLTTESTMTSCKTFRQKSTIVEKLGHTKKNCRDFKAEEGWMKKKTKSQKATATTMQENSVESSGLTASHTLSV